MADTQLTLEQLQAIARAQAKITSEQQKQKEISGDLIDSYDQIENSLDSISKLINNQLKDQGASARQVSEIRSIYTSLNKTNKELQYLNDKFYEGSLKTKDVSKQISQLERTETSIRRQINIAYAQGNNTLAAKFEKELRILDIERKEGEELKKQNEYVDKRVGLTGKLLTGLEKIPILGDAIDFEEINTNMRSAVGNTNVFGAGLKTAGKQLAEGLKDPLVLTAIYTATVKKMFDLYGEVNQRLVDQQKQLGINAEASDKLYQSAYQYASQQESAFVTDKRILEGRYKLNEALGTSIAFSNEEAITAERLSHYYGLSEEQNAHLAVLAIETNQTNSDILNTVIKTAATQKAQAGGTISYQKVLQKVSTTSGDILTKFKGNTQALTAAIMQADKLGLTLEQVDKVGESLLNFESSIESELKAELLTGKAINLEKARSAALSGDTAKLTQEIAKQTGGIHEFEKLNTVQRKAYAEAFGMEVGEMGDMLRKKEFEAKLGADAAKSASEQLRIAKERGITIEESVQKDLEAHSLAESQKYVFEKIQSILTRISAGPMATIYHFLEKGFHFAEGILSTFGKMTGGALGSALGAAVLAAPLLIGTTRLMAGGLKGLFFQRGTPLNPMIVQMQGVASGNLGSQFAGGSFSAGKDIVAKRQGGGFGGYMKGVTNRLATGAGIGLAGTALSSISGNMEEGTGKDITGVAGNAATYAGLGFTVGGPWGAAIGGLVGVGLGLIEVTKAHEETRKAQEAARAASTKKTEDLLEQLAVRPIKLDVGTNTVAQWNTANNQYGNSGAFA